MLVPTVKIRIQLFQRYSLYLTPFLWKFFRLASSKHTRRLPYRCISILHSTFFDTSGTRLHPVFDLGGEGEGNWGSKDWTVEGWGKPPLFPTELYPGRLHITFNLLVLPEYPLLYVIVYDTWILGRTSAYGNITFIDTFALSTFWWL